MAYASASDVEVELGRPAVSAAETAQWEAWLERVERAIRRRFTREGYDLDVQVALDAPTEEDVIDVEVARVVDKINNPTSSTSTTTTRSVDDASISNTTRREGVDTGEALTITDAEWVSLLPVRPRRSKAFSILPS
ncbi:Gp19/Gp15/Gp42 family protein [Aeromicrobium sp. 9AM]|uniref:Gp19/Gp15/Gp42 family protein n=1 Tax=Aeromicrobium sp. 9AM TaxID=2653126 RepID=UPI0012EFDF78|nr:Gp19/Gp15/Gp42 family protein [Aeromicrobium sp. 9AM]VXC08559.1 putative Phage protein Gp19/Gp15/Gp42 [Aeromicrobium sp. 9AM]